MRSGEFENARMRMLAALERMLCRYPYHAEWLSPERWRPDPAVGTMAVSVKNRIPRFLFSPAFVSTCRDDELEGVIHHELNHLVFGHPFLDPGRYDNRHALTIAEEITVNEHVREPLPGSPLTLNQFPELPAGEDTVTRYHRLAKRDDLAERARTLDMHSLWQGDGQRMSAADMESVHQTLIAQIHNSQNREALHWALSGIGAHSGTGTMTHLGDPPPHHKPLPWAQILNDAIGQRVRREATYHRPPRRMPKQVGVVPGTICRPEKPPVMAAIDTSSSMKREQFERIRGELDCLRTLAFVTVVQCDKKIRNTFTLRGQLHTIVGRGGTDLRPPLEPEFLDRHRPSMVIYFTDGDGRVPKRAPDVPVVWCLTTKNKPPASWGQVVKLE